jgi:putative endonuclease
MVREARQKAERRGQRGEVLAALFLRLKGYTIHARNVRTPVGEIDIIASRRGVIVFVEVKARDTITDALSAVTPTAWQRISSAADNWMARRSNLGLNGWRYDIIGVAPWRWPHHQIDAWRPGLA